MRPVDDVSLLVLLLALPLFGWSAVVDHTLVTINRHHKGDMFVTGGASCSNTSCVGSTGGTAAPADGDCACQCVAHLPVFRDDLQVCIDDIHECRLAPFVSGSTAQPIPFVFLPLEGQIVHPSAEISFAGVTTPICVVSNAQFLTHSGWTDLRNNLYTEPPFRLFRDEGRTFLQWLGEVDLRLRMEGRLILVHLLCKDVGVTANAAQDQTLFTPCVAFRVAGSPRDNGMHEVSFPSDGTRTGLSVSEYVAIGVCSILLGLIYVASVFLYLHVRRRRRGADSEKGGRRDSESVHLTGEEGVVKNNPLLASRHHLGLLGADNASYLSDSASCCSDTDACSDTGAASDDSTQNMPLQVTSAVVHACTGPFALHYAASEPMHPQDSSSIERLPEEDVSIVETLEGREERPETVRAMTNGIARRKLYFNPAYFEPEMLLAPPPAAIEFLTKIREVISIAKHKMAAKRFAPSLLGIPEEDLQLQQSVATQPVHSLKRENSRRRNCESDDTLTNACPGCCPSASESKQHSIRRWLEDVPTLSPAPKNVKRKDSKRLAPPPPPPVVPPAAIPVTISVPELQKDEVSVSIVAAKSPPPSIAPKSMQPSLRPSACPPPPPMPSPTSEVRDPNASETQSEQAPEDASDADSEVPVVAKQLMDAVIKELEGQAKKPNLPNGSDCLRMTLPDGDFEADSLERAAERGMSTPSDYGDVENSALPLEEQLTAHDDVLAGNGGKADDDHEYEIIVLNPEVNSEKDLKMFSLPELLNHNDGYSLVSEVYVNDGYVFSSTPSSPGNTSSASSSYSSGPKIRYSEPENKPGHLTIQVEDSPDNYRRVPDDSDTFEPDTLDRPYRRKCSGSIVIHSPSYREHNETFLDSLERPAQIMLRTTGSFKSDSLGRSEATELANILATSPLNRTFGSLREMYEARTKVQKPRECDTNSVVGSTRSLNSDTDCNHTLSWKRAASRFEGVLLNPEAKQARRQRRPTPPSSPKRPHKQTLPGSSPPLPPKPNALYQAPPPPRPLREPTPPLPPRNYKPPLPPKNGVVRSTSQKSTTSNPARRPLPPLPQCGISRGDSLSSTSSVSRDIETLSNLSGASVDSLNSSDYEAFYNLPLSGEDEEVDGSRTLGQRVERSLNNKFTPPSAAEENSLNSQFILQPITPTLPEESSNNRQSDSSENGVSKGMQIALGIRQRVGKDLVKHMRDKRGSDVVKKTWRRVVERASPKTPAKPEDSGYLSSDSNESGKHTEGQTASISETDESLCDGASESGGESIATDSFFFDNFRKLSKCAVVTESVDSGVGSDLLRSLNNPSLLDDIAASSSDSENVSFVTVLPPGSGRCGTVRC